MKPTLIILIVFLLFGCVGMEYDKISDEVVYEPTIALPVGSFSYDFDNAYQIPGEIPMIGDLTPVDVVLNDTLFFSLNDSFESREYIQKAFLHYDIVNRFPAKGILRLYYLDNSFNAVEFTPAGGVEVEPAGIDDTGVITKESKETSFVEITDHLDGLYAADRIIIELEVSDLILTNEVRLNFNKYSIKSSVGVRVELKFELNEGSL
ncbi:hypothetical protein [Carboxylicivirga caseinilyticus]|uniref:hypothetical protein n=1 Tax=Carboxylicivirga caseinilyticus TaxID=3417572 RepID=UPI003D34442B|nr:hypothetical protein [Marinilabiliaceae bacterium A049]